MKKTLISEFGLLIGLCLCLPACTPETPPDPCADVTCNEGQICREGRCEDDYKPPVDPCEGKVCGENEICQDGICIGNCGGRICPENQKCVNDTCVEDTTKDPKKNDSDGDGISDFFEGSGENVDTDGDGTPDYLDTDSDNDTIPDSIEGGCESLADPPIDSDFDGTPDFRDKDSDDNGIPDENEAYDKDGNLLDTNSNGIPDYRDADNDGNGIFDIDEITGLASKTLKDGSGNPARGGDCNGDGQPDAPGTAEHPWDCDSDTVPDYNDPDNDGDTIPDNIERTADTDEDGFFDIYSQDSDGDTISDMEEAGMKDGVPADTDGDTIPDFRDLDSDNDGISDAVEATMCTSQLLEDTDHDGDSDLIEWAAGTDPCDEKSNSSAIGNFVFMAPYEQSVTPDRRTLSFDTAVQILDIYFSGDNTGSMFEVQKKIKDTLVQIIDNLKCKDLGRDCTINAECADLGKSICSEDNRCIVSPVEGEGCFANMWTGVGRWNDIDTFHNILSLQNSVESTVTAFEELLKKDPAGKEAPMQAPLCAAKGEESEYCGNKGTGEKRLSCSTEEGRIGCVGYRKDAIKVYIQVSDANDQCGEALKCQTFTDGTVAGQAMQDNDIRFIGLYPLASQANIAESQDEKGHGTAQSVAETLGKAAGSVDANGNPFVYRADGDEAVNNTIKGVRTIARAMSLHITADVQDIDEGASKFIKELRVNSSGEIADHRICTKTVKGTGSPYQSIEKLLPGISVCYDVIPVEQNTFVEPTAEPQMFRAKIRILGDGSVLNSGIAYFVVPPKVTSGHDLN